MEHFCRQKYHGYLIQGDVPGAMNYVKQFPDQRELYDRFADRFEGAHTAYEGDRELNEILCCYQRYYRDVFYLRIGREEAGEKLRAGLAALLGADGGVPLESLEENQAAEAFQSRGFHFLGGLTSGYYGPYIWRTAERRTFEVELPDGIQQYTVNLLDRFLSRSWLDYISFGEIGTGGWTDRDGLINCIRSAYDLDSESFKVSLLKHEAQHAKDLADHGEMSSASLEYRAKLVELIYSRERNLLERFLREADSSDKRNGHTAASERIAAGFTRKLKLPRAELEGLPIERVQAAARALFEESSSALA